MNIMIDKEVRPYLNDRGIINQIQYAVNQMIAGEEKDRTTTLHTMVGTFYVYDFEGTLYVMKKA